MTFTVTSDGTTPFTYQWYKDGVALPGATSETYVVSAAASADAGTYNVVVSNTAGSTTSDNAVLTVTAATTAPTFTTQPSSQTIASGSAVTFTAAASGSPTPTFQWRKDGTNIAGATGASFSIASVAAGDAGTYTVVATNTAGSVTSSNAVLTVSAPAETAPVITTQPVGQSISASQGAVFTVAASGSVSSYQWQRKPAGSSNWEDLNEGGSYCGVETASLTINSATAAMSGDQFRCVTTNASGSTTTNAITLTVAASAALLQYPAGIARDGAGNLYVADASKNTILKITASGVVTTFAGAAGSVGSQDGAAASARFNQPSDVAVDAAGNVYVADTGNATIRMITPSGTVTTLAGSAASRGSRDGSGSAALFNQPVGLAVDAAGNVYVADTQNATIRKITPLGAVTTLAGSAGVRGDTDGAGAAARFNFPSDVAIDAAGNLYVADSYNHTIRKITPAGTVTTLAGSAGISGAVDLTGTNALFNQPAGLAVDSAGNVYVADTANASIRKIAPGGAVTTLAGVAGIAGLADGAGGNALFNQPHALVVDASGGLLVADTGNAAIRRVAADCAVTTLALTNGDAAATPPPDSGATPLPPSGSASASVSGGGGGGGGAPSVWFLAALLLLRAGAWMVRRR